MDNQSPVSSPNFPPQVVQCTGLTQRYESSPTPVLEDINFSLEQGESMAVLGVPGSGKSTLLHLIAGLDDLQQGKVQICGQDIHRLDDSSRCALRNQFLPKDVYPISAIPSLLLFSDVIIVASIALVMSLLATFYPSYHASKVLPAIVLREK